MTCRALCGILPDFWGSLLLVGSQKMVGISLPSGHAAVRVYGPHPGYDNLVSRFGLIRLNGLEP